MWFPLIPLYISAVTASSYGFSFRSAKGACPPKEELHPCTCTVKQETHIYCKNISDVSTLNNVFSKSSTWNVQNVHIENCVMDYIPSIITKMTTMKMLNVSTSTLVSLFEAKPSNTTKFELFVYNCKIRRQIEWSLFKDTSVVYFGFFNIPFKFLGEEFRDSLTPKTEFVWLQNTKLTRLVDKVFVNLNSAIVICLKGGLLETVSRDWFAYPCNVKFLYLSEQRIKYLPENMLKDMPKLVAFHCERNRITTLNQNLYTQSNGLRFVVTGNPIDCDCCVKWITTFKKNTETSFWGDCAAPASFKGKELYLLEPKDFKFCKADVTCSSP